MRTPADNGVASASTHDPTLIGDVNRSTRSIARNRAFLPRSAISSADPIPPPTAPIHRHFSSKPRNSAPPKTWAARPSVIAAPATPPTKKYAGTDQIHTGSFNTGRS